MVTLCLVLDPCFSLKLSRRCGVATAVPCRSLSSRGVTPAGPSYGRIALVARKHAPSGKPVGLTQAAYRLSPSQAPTAHHLLPVTPTFLRDQMNLACRGEVEGACDEGHWGVIRSKVELRLLRHDE
jgi:hypothetical protein